MLEKSFLNPSNQGPVREGIRKLSKFAETLEKSRLSSGFYNTEMGAKSPENNRILLASILGVTFWHFGSYYGELIILKTHTMKSLPILLPILAALVIASCKTQPIAPGETATIKGQVLLAPDVNNNGVSGSATPPFNGVQVMLEG